jgi:cytochrome c-type biogenesis protein CcmH/NrfF
MCMYKNTFLKNLHFTTRTLNLHCTNGAQQQITTSQTTTTKNIKNQIATKISKKIH